MLEMLNLNVVTSVNGILHKRLICYGSYFFFGIFLGFTSKEYDIKMKVLTMIMFYFCLLVLLSVASLVVMSVTITTILQTITFFVPLSTTQFNYD